MPPAPLPLACPPPELILSEEIKRKENEAEGEKGKTRKLVF
jgi:hypothetical protein